MILYSWLAADYWIRAFLWKLRRFVMGESLAIKVIQWPTLVTERWVWS